MALSDYTQTPFGTWIKRSDDTGPYTVNVGHGTGGPLIQLASAFWVADDGSGPYFYNPASGVVSPAFQLGA